jgi:hypothetical protein
MKPMIRTAAAVVASALCACSSSSSPADVTGPARRVASIDVRPHHNRLALLAPRGAMRARQLSALVLDDRGAPVKTAAVAWSSDAGTVQVDAGGMLTLAQPGGPAHVRARSGGASGTAGVCPLLFDNDFEDDAPGPLTRAGIDSAWNHPAYVTGLDRVDVVEGAEAFGGGRSLRVRYPAGSVGPDQGGAIWVMPLGGSYDELYTSYMVKFGPGFDFVLGGKLPGLAGGAQNTGGRKPTGQDGWSARGMWFNNGRMIQYVYHPDQPGDFGEGMAWMRNGKPLQVVPGRWYHVEHRVVMNTPGQRDGVVQAWLDGVLVLDRRGMRFRDVGSFGIDAFQFNTFFGGSRPENAARRDEVVYFDDVVISLFHVGPNGPLGMPECQPDAE